VAQGAMRSVASLKYSFENDYHALVVSLREVLADAGIDLALEVIIQAWETAQSPELLGDCISEFATLDEPTRSRVAFALQIRAYTGQPTVEGLWEALANDSWRTSLAEDVSVSTINRLCDASIHWQRDAETNQRAALPHHFLLASIASKDRPEVSDTFMGYCLAACAAAGCTSALERATSAGNASAISEVLAEWYKRVDAIIRVARPLAASRLRPLKLVLATSGVH
jgi:hypothetical protein